MKFEFLIFDETKIIAHRYLLLTFAHVHLINILIYHVLFSVAVIVIIVWLLVGWMELLNLFL